LGVASPAAQNAAAPLSSEAHHPGSPAAPSILWEEAASAELTFKLAHDGELRLGAWGELRTSSDPVAGGELVLHGLPPNPEDSRIDGTGSLVLRVGGNAHLITGAIGFGYVGSFNDQPLWIHHVVGARIVASMNRSLDDPHDWSVTVGLEAEPIGLVHAIVDLVTGD
jgi:hypothetical protein